MQVGERVLWFRPQDLSGDDRKFALPYIGPYIVTELKGLNNVFIRLENSTQEPFLVNEDQLSRCYAGLSMEGPLQFSHTTKPRRANRGRKACLKENAEQAQPSHQMTLRQMQNLNFDGNVNSILRCAMMDSKRIEVACDRDRMAKPVLRSLSEESTAEQRKISPSAELDVESELELDVESELELDGELDVALDVERNRADVEEEIEDVAELMKMEDAE
ncbi:MAG: hypothetical protein GY820_46680, partial [Gammaproteobacteria bacterium]|nr:hypothetical protein [Gammaproteobacteria bacterium]